jgi:hypothetical protein
MFNPKLKPVFLAVVGVIAATSTVYAADKAIKADTVTVYSGTPLPGIGLPGEDGADGVNGHNGANGINGLNGMVPILEFSIDGDGDLAYEVIGYEEGPTLGERFPTQEW